MNFQSSLLVVVSCFLVSGCGKPPQALPTLPPGAELREIPPSDLIAEPSAALGESALTQKTQGGDPKANAEAPPAIKPEDAIKEGLKIQTVAEGKGDDVKPGQIVRVHYTGRLTNGKVFDSSVERNNPFVFALGSGQVIKGWEAGVQGMKVGEKRKLTIPASLGYGDRAQGSIPPNSTLEFDIELLAIEK